MRDLFVFLFGAVCVLAIAVGIVHLILYAVVFMFIATQWTFMLPAVLFVARFDEWLPWAVAVPIAIFPAFLIYSFISRWITGEY
jgi:hypothetical protein